MWKIEVLAVHYQVAGESDSGGWRQSTRYVRVRLGWGWLSYGKTGAWIDTKYWDAELATLFIGEFDGEPASVEYSIEERRSTGSYRVISSKPWEFRNTRAHSEKSQKHSRRRRPFRPNICLQVDSHQLKSNLGQKAKYSHRRALGITPRSGWKFQVPWSPQSRSFKRFHGKSWSRRWMKKQ